MSLEFVDLDPDSQRLVVSYLDPASRLCLSLSSQPLYSQKGPLISQFEFIAICVKEGFVSLVELAVRNGCVLVESHVALSSESPRFSRQKFAILFKKYFESNNKVKQNLDDWVEGLIKLSLSASDKSLADFLLSHFQEKSFYFPMHMSYAVNSSNPIDIITYVKLKLPYAKEKEGEIRLGVMAGISMYDDLDLWKHYYGSVKLTSELTEFIGSLQPKKVNQESIKIIKHLFDVQFPDLVKVGFTPGSLIDSFLIKLVDIGDFVGLKYLCGKFQIPGTRLNEFGLSLVSFFPFMEISETIKELELLGYSAHLNSSNASEYKSALFPYVDFDRKLYQKNKQRETRVSFTPSTIAKCLDKYISQSLYANIDDGTLHEIFLHCCMTNDLALLDFLEGKTNFSWKEDINLFLEAIVKTVAAEAVPEDIFIPLMADLIKRNPFWFGSMVQVPNEGFGIYNAGFGNHSLLVHLLKCCYSYPMRLHYLLTSLEHDEATWKRLLIEAELPSDSWSFQTFLRASIIKISYHDEKKYFEMIRLVAVTYGKIEFTKGYLEKYIYADIRSHGEWTIPLIEKLKIALKTE